MKSSPVQDVMKEGDRFITVYADLDLAYKTMNWNEASGISIVRMIEEKDHLERFTYWKFESEEGHRTFIVKTQENTAVHELKELLEGVKKKRTARLLRQYPNHIKGSAESEEVSKKRRDCSLLQMHRSRVFTIQNC